MDHAVRNQHPIQVADCARNGEQEEQSDRGRCRYTKDRELVRGIGVHQINHVLLCRNKSMIGLIRACMAVYIGDSGVPARARTT